MIQLKRVYDEYSEDDGIRILVERLWPRGVSKEKARIDMWMKEIAPSTGLRKWFNHEDSKWEEFARRYRNELTDNTELKSLKEIVNRNRNVTLIYSSRNKYHNSAVVLYGMLEP